MKHIKLYEEFVNEAAEPKFAVHEGAAVMGYASSKIQARQNAKVQGAEYSTVEDYKEQYGDKFITEAKVKVGDTLYKNGRKGKVVKVMSDMANVDFGGGDVYGITFRRIKGDQIEERAQWTDKMNDAQRDIYDRIVPEIDASTPYKRDRIYNHDLLGLALDKDKGFKNLSKAEQSYVGKALSGVLNFQLMNER